MTSFVLFDEASARTNLLPLTFTRPVCEIRTGILSIREKWELVLNTKVHFLTQDYLQEKFPVAKTAVCVFINGKISPTKKLAETIGQLADRQALFSDQTLIAFKGEAGDLERIDKFEKLFFKDPFIEINQLWDIFQKNGAAIQADFELLTSGKKSKPLSNTVTVIGDKNLLFLEEGAKAEACILNTSDGPIYLGKDSEVMEGSVVRGPFALCEHSALKLSAKVYGPTTIGPHCKVGGEISNSVILGFSNKAHDGFLGNSVIGEWCNLGADSNNSNLKNNYGNVKLYHFGKKKQVDTGLQFCGLIMGDHSKCGINTMFNTGTVVGVGSNIYGGGFPPVFIENFSWGGSSGFEPYKLEKLFETAERVFERRGLKFDQTEKNILQAIARQS